MTGSINPNEVHIEAIERELQVTKTALATVQADNRRLRELLNSFRDLADKHKTPTGRFDINTVLNAVIDDQEKDVRALREELTAAKIAAEDIGKNRALNLKAAKDFSDLVAQAEARLVALWNVIAPYSAYYDGNRAADADEAVIALREGRMNIKVIP